MDINLVKVDHYVADSGDLFPTTAPITWAKTVDGSVTTTVLTAVWEGKTYARTITENSSNLTGSSTQWVKV